MFIDDAVAAGLVTVALMVLFLVGVGVFIYQDAKKGSGNPYPDSDKPLN